MVAILAREGGRGRTGWEGELVKKENWARRRTSQEGELVKKENWWRRRTGQEGELFEKENLLRRRTGWEGELVEKENWWGRRTWSDGPNQTTRTLTPSAFMVQNRVSSGSLETFVAAWRHATLSEVYHLPWRWGSPGYRAIFGGFPPNTQPNGLKLYVGIVNI